MAAPVVNANAASTNGTGASSNLTCPTVAPDDIIFIQAIAKNTSGTVATAFTWPAGFTQIFAVNNKDAAGVARGLCGLAWKRADGSEDGTSLTVTHNGATGTATCLFAQVWTATGCATSGDPYDQAVTNNPNNTTAVDWPSITTTGTDKSLVTGLLNSDNNANAATPTNWGAIFAAGTSTGSDASSAVFDREGLAAGSYDPSNQTLANTNATGYVTYQIELKPAASAVTLACSIAGVGAVTSASRETKKVASSIAGLGAVTAAGKTQKDLLVDVSGVAAVAPAATVTAGGSDVLIAAAIAGQGGVTVAVGVDRKLAVTVGGLGAVTAAARDTKKLASTVVAAGSLTAADTIGGTALYSAAISGVGALEAPMRLDDGLSVSVAGAGTVSAETRELLQLQASIAAIAAILPSLTVDLAGASVDRLRNLLGVGV